MSQNLYLKFAILQIPSFRLLTEGSPWLHVCAFVHAMGHGRGFYFQFTCGGFNPFVPYRSHNFHICKIHLIFSASEHCRRCMLQCEEDTLQNRETFCGNHFDVPHFSAV